MMQYRFISADPPWPYNKWDNPEGLPHRRSRGRGLATGVYKSTNGSSGVMPLERLLGLGPLVQAVTEDNAALLLWTTGPHLPTAFKLADAWGFTHYSTKLFCWLKTNKTVGRRQPIDRERDIFRGLGYWTAANTEDALLFLKGRDMPSRVSYSEVQPIIAPVGEHSEKPVEAHDRLEIIMGPGNYLDLFARRYRRGKQPGCLWTGLGNELDDLDIYQSLEKLANLDLAYVPKGVKEPLTPASAVEVWQEQLRPEPQPGHQMRLAI